MSDTNTVRVPVDIDALKRERSRLLDQAREIMNAARVEDRDLTQDEAKAWQEAMDSANARGNQIEREETLQTAERRYEGLPNPTVPRPDPSDPNRIGMAKEDVQGYSFLRAIRAKLSGESREAPVEMEASAQIAKRLGRQPRSNGFFVPFEVAHGMERRDITVGTEGVDIVAVDLQPIIDLLRNRMVVKQAGARVLTGLRGDVQFPKLTAAATAAWVTEGAAPAESTQTFGQVKLSPKQLAAFTDITRQTLLQSSFDVEATIREDLARVLAIELDRVGLHGTGVAPQPAGIGTLAGVNLVDLGANGAAPIWANILQLEEVVAIANADLGALAYITNPKVRRKMKTVERATNTGIFAWNDLAPYGTPTTPLNGYAALVTNQVRSDLTDGTGTALSAIFFGNWEEAMYGIWSDFEVLVDPYTQSTTGIVRLVALMNADFNVRHPESFAKIVDAITV